MPSHLFPNNDLIKMVTFIGSSMIEFIATNPASLILIAAILSPIRVVALIFVFNNVLSIPILLTILLAIHLSCRLLHVLLVTLHSWITSKGLSLTALIVSESAHSSFSILIDSLASEYVSSLLLKAVFTRNDHNWNSSFSPQYISASVHHFYLQISFQVSFSVKIERNKSLTFTSAKLQRNKQIFQETFLC